MSAKRENPTAVLSKKMIQDALLKQMKNGHYESISITDLAKASDLARRTFYRHYNTKEDVLLDIFSTYHDEYILALKSAQTVKLPDITEVFFRFWAEKMDFLHLISKNKLMHVFLDQMNQSISHIYDDIKGHLNEYDDPETLKYALAFSVGGHYNTLILWLNESTKKEPSEMKRIIQTALKVSLD